jgi:pyruvate formate lyase activating enzyme
MPTDSSLMKKTPEVDHGIVVGGLTPLTTIDYPGELAAVVFLQGCPWRCGYCQNNDLIARDNQNTIAWHEVITLLENRKGLLDAVVFSGGEPTLQSGLGTAMQQVKSLGYKIGLHTAGIYPDRLQKLLPLLDWVGMDIKSAKEDYQQITGAKGSGERAWKSAQLLVDSDITHEFRTTVHPDMLNKAQLTALVTELTELGAKNYVIQECVTGRCLDEARQVTRTGRIDAGQLKEFGDRFSNFSIRAA